jgi:hypothetical protein
MLASTFGAECHLRVSPKITHLIALKVQYVIFLSKYIFFYHEIR